MATIASSESQQQSPQESEDPVDDPNKGADADHNDSDDTGVVENLLFGRPDDFFDFATKLFGEAGNFCDKPIFFLLLRLLFGRGRRSLGFIASFFRGLFSHDFAPFAYLLSL